MLKDIVKYEYLLKLLATASSTTAREIIQHSEADFINLLSKCAEKILNREVILSTNQIKKLFKCRVQLNKLVSRNVSVKRRKLTIQKGGLSRKRAQLLLQGLLGSIDLKEKKNSP